MGAWIETLQKNGVIRPKSESLPTWERGLKQNYKGRDKVFDASLPTWERGLKHQLQYLDGKREKSLPTWERGLKLHTLTDSTLIKRRSPHGSVD